MQLPSNTFPLVPLRPETFAVIFSCQRATHRGQRLHVGAHQTQVADHVQNPVVGGEVQRRPSILQETKRPGRVLTLAAEDDVYGGISRGQHCVRIWEPPGRDRRRGLLALQKLAISSGRQAKQNVFKYFSANRVTLK